MQPQVQNTVSSEVTWSKNKEMTPHLSQVPADVRRNWRWGGSHTGALWIGRILSLADWFSRAAANGKTHQRASRKCWLNKEQVRADQLLSCNFTKRKKLSAYCAVEEPFQIVQHEISFCWAVFMYCAQNSDWNFHFKLWKVKISKWYKNDFFSCTRNVRDMESL